MSGTTPYKRESPFLHRVWRSAVDGLAGLASTNGDKSIADDSPRPTKRRRMAEDSLDPGLVAAVGPLFSDPSDGHTRALRVQVLRIGRNYSSDPDANGLMQGNGSPVKKDVPVKVIRARCKLTIFKYIPRVEMQPIYCDSQTCEIKIFRDSDGVCRQARVYLRQPFQVAAEKLYIERDDPQGYMLADCYLIQTELDSAGDANWPPLDLLHGQDYHGLSTPPRQWVLSAAFTYTYTKGRLTTPVTLRSDAGPGTQIDLDMETDLRWSTLASQARRPQAEHGSQKVDVPRTNGALEPLTNGHVNRRAEGFIDGHGNRDDDDPAADEDDGEGEATTPSRSLRMRGKQQNYNLKLLSDKARGKELKERKKRKDAKVVDVKQVTWIFPANGRLVLDNWTCVRCFTEHDTVGQLKAHLSQHSEVKFTTDFTARGGWRIAVSAFGQETPLAIRTADFEPRSPDGDEDESEGELSPVKPSARSRQKPPMVKCKAPDGLHTSKQLIPNIKQPVYDLLSKAILKPLSYVDEPPVNNSWSLQKHRDIIKDYTDVHPDEKEYISMWDAFSLTHKATFAPHLKDIYLSFLEEKSLWLASSQNRMTEALNHMAYLNARDALDGNTVAKAVGILKKARVRARQVQPSGSASPNAEAHSSRSGCTICGLPIPGPRQLICANLDCERPWYHDDCVEGDAMLRRGSPDWQCDDCYVEEAVL